MFWTLKSYPLSYEFREKCGLFISLFCRNFKILNDLCPIHNETLWQSLMWKKSLFLRLDQCSNILSKAKMRWSLLIEIKIENNQFSRKNEYIVVCCRNLISIKSFVSALLLMRFTTDFFPFSPTFSRSLN